MSGYRDGFVDPDNQVILTADGVERLDYPRLTHAFERIGSAAITLGYAAFSRMAMLRYPLPDKDFMPKPRAEACRSVGAICAGTCIFFLAAKGPAFAETAAIATQQWLDENITDPMARFADSSSWVHP